MTRALWFLVPEGVDDPLRVSGGNVYDRRLRDGLARGGHDVRMAPIADGDQVMAALGAVPSGGSVLVDGLVAGWAPAALEEHAGRVRLILLAHMVAAAFPDVEAETVEAERRALRCADRVIATSGWTAGELVRRGLSDADRIVVAIPGVRDAPAAVGPVDHGALLCIGVLAPHKGQDLLLAALERIPRSEWTCTLAGSAATDPAYAAGIAARATSLGDRVRLTGVLDGAELDRAYRAAAVLVAPSRAESFGMAIADARRRGLPVIAAAVGGIPEAVAGGGALLVEPDDAGALAAALDAWMTDPALRARLRVEALRARSAVPGWADTVARVDEMLAAA